MPVKLLETDLPQLLCWLEQYLPHSFKIYGELRSHVRGHFPGLELFVDKWPHPKAAVALVNPEVQQLPCKEYLANVVQGLYGVDPEALKDLLTDPKVVDWDTRNSFACVTDSLRTLMESMIDQMDRRCRVNPNFLLKATQQQVKPIPVPQGLKFQPISTTEINIINSTWKFATQGSDQYIQYLVQHFPAVYLVTDEGHHVGHMISYSYGTMGLLYVNPEFRGRGYAKVIITQLARIYFDRGEDVYVNVEESNPLSVCLHESVGFWVVPELRLLWITCSPKRCSGPLSAKCCV